MNHQTLAFGLLLLVTVLLMGAAVSRSICALRREVAALRALLLGVRTCRFPVPGAEGTPVPTSARAESEVPMVLRQSSPMPSSPDMTPIPSTRPDGPEALEDPTEIYERPPTAP